MTISLHVAGTPPTYLEQALILGTYLPVRPAGVRVRYYNVATLKGAPLFGFDQQDGHISGWDRGVWTPARADDPQIADTNIPLFVEQNSLDFSNLLNSGYFLLL